MVEFALFYNLHAGKHAKLLLIYLLVAEIFICWKISLGL